MQLPSILMKICWQIVKHPIIACGLGIAVVLKMIF